MVKASSQQKANPSPHLTPTWRCPWRQPKGHWISESYHVKGQYFRLICKKFNFFPTVDAFSQASTARCAVWWGPGSENSQDAFSQSWSGHRLWFNPPFSLLPQVIAKIREDQAHGILVAPEWKLSRWHKEAMRMSLGDWLFPKGTKLFDHPERSKPSRVSFGRLARF